MNWREIEQSIDHVTQENFKVISARTIGGGSINSAYRLEGKNSAYFVKLNNRQCLPMFEAEMAGLNEINACQLVRVPLGIGVGTTADRSFLVLEYIRLGPGSRASDLILGRHLAQMHQLAQSYFGWHQDNTIGSTPQENNASDSWIEFFRDRRLAFQLQLAEHNGYSSRLQKLGEKLLSDLTGLFTGYQPVPSLLHGDLWGGNAAVDEQSLPVIFDPACYYGDREADLAMTELFGGFSADFYAAYAEIYPLHSGYSVRKDLYNLYHILNHLNLFGRGYAMQAESLMQRLLAEIK